MKPETPLDAFSLPARSVPDLWRLFASIFLIFGALLLLGFGIGAIGLWLNVQNDGVIEIEGFETRASALLVLASFLIWRPAIWFSMRWLYKRSMGTTFGPTGRVAWSGFRQGLSIATAFAVLSTIIAWGSVGAPVWLDLNLAVWAGFGLIAVPLIYFQSSAEEMMFRGLILQQMSVRFGAFWAWALVPSILFGLLHWNPAGYGAAVWFVLGITTLTALIFAMVTAATGNLGLAMGLHFGLNLFALLLIAPSDKFAALALAHWPISDDALFKLLYLDLIALTIACVAAATFYRRSLTVS